MLEGASNLIFLFQVGLDDTQLEGIRRVNSISSGGSRLQFLEELSAPKGVGRSGSESIGASIKSFGQGPSGSTSNSQDIWCSQDFALKLAPPTITFEGFEE